MKIINQSMMVVAFIALMTSAMAANTKRPLNQVKPVAAPVLPLGLDTPVGSVDLRHVRVSEVIRLIAELTSVNVVATPAASEIEVTLYLRGTTARVMLDNLAKVAGLWYRWRPDTQTWLIMTAEEFQRDSTTLGVEETRVLHLRHHNVVSAANALRAMFGDRVKLTLPVEESLGEQIKVTALRRGGGTNTGTNAGNNTVGSNASNSTSNGNNGNSNGVEGNSRTISGGTLATSLSEGAQQQAAAQTESGAAPSVVKAAKEGREASIFVTYNKLHNLLILRSGDEKVLDQCANLVKEMDLPARQVLLEMRIIEVRLNDEFHRAFDFDLFGSDMVSNASGSQPVNPLTNATSGPKLVGALGNFDLLDKNTGLFQFINTRVRARLQLLEEKGRVKTLARPLLLASNNEAARLFIGEEVVLVTGASSQTTTGTTGANNTTITAETEKRNIGTTLVVHPRINENKTVTLTIDQESSARIVGGTSIPLAVGGSTGVLNFPIDTVNTSATQVVALAKDNLTIAVGGLIKIDRSKTDSTVPGLSSIPILGELFKKEERMDEQSELILLVTPHVIETPEEGEIASNQVKGRIDADMHNISVDTKNHDDHLSGRK